LLGRGDAAAGGGNDLVPALRQTPAEALGHAPRADEADAKRHLILLLHLVHLPQWTLRRVVLTAQDAVLHQV